MIYRETTVAVCDTLGKGSRDCYDSSGRSNITQAIPTQISFTKWKAWRYEGKL